MTLRRALAPRIRPLALVVVALVALLLATLLLPATPANAGGNGSGSSDQGPPVSNGGYEMPSAGGDSGGGGGDPNVVCFNGNSGVWKNGKFRVRVYGAAHCNSTPATDTWKLCTAGFQVFRFYGTEANPARSTTVSMMNKDRWCNAGDAEENRGFGFWTTSGYDNQNAVGNGNWSTENTDVERGVNFKSASGDGSRTTAPMYLGVWSTVRMTDKKETYIGTGRPYWKMGGADCVDVRQVDGAGDHPIKAFMNASTTTPEARAEVFRWFSGAYSAMRDQIGIASAKKELGIDGITGNDILWDTTGRCASPIEYSSTTNADDRTNPAFDPAKNRVTGVCYIPVVREGRMSRNGLFAYDSLRKNAGLRYSTYYQGQAGTHGNWLRADNTTTASGSDWETGVVKAWRDKITGWYNSQAKTDGDVKTANYYFDSEETTDQRLPAGPYSNKLKGETAQVFFTDAMDALQNATKCRFGSRFAAVKNADPEPRVPPMVGTVTLHNKYVLHAGGASPAAENVQEFALSVDATCNASTTADQELCQKSKPQILGAGADVSVSMPPGYTICEPNRPGEVADGCDFAIADHDCVQYATPGSTAPNACRFRIEGPVNATKFKLVFYGPTEGADKVQIGISNVDVSFSYVIDTGTYLLFDSAWHDWTATEGGFQSHVDTLNVRTVIDKFTPTVAGAPVPMPLDGTGRYSYEAPVIGAVSGAAAGDVSIN